MAANHTKVDIFKVLLFYLVKCILIQNCIENPQKNKIRELL